MTTSERAGKPTRPPAVEAGATSSCPPDGAAVTGGAAEADPPPAAAEGTVIKLCCKPVSSLVSSLYGMLAGAIVYRIWVRIERHDDALQASRAQRGWQQAALVAAFQQVIFGVVQATVLHRVFPVIGLPAGTWPAGGGQQLEKAARS